jgi:hypothetical protein
MISSSSSNVPYPPEAHQAVAAYYKKLQRASNQPSTTPLTEDTEAKEDTQEIIMCPL